MVSTLIGYDGRPMIDKDDVSWMVFFSDVQHFWHITAYGMIVTDDFDESGFEDAPLPHNYLGMGYEKIVDNFKELGTVTWSRSLIFEKGAEA